MKQDVDIQGVRSIKAPEPAQAEASSRPDGRRPDDELIASLALEIWRMRRGVARVLETTDGTVIRPVSQSLDRIEDLMAAHELEFRTHDGQLYTEGSTLEVVYAREKSEVLIVVETLQPTILRAGRIILNGQVILGAAEAEGRTGSV